MSLIQSQSLLTREFNTLSEENKQLKDQIIQITLSQENLIQQNNKLHQENNSKDKLIIETKLKSKHLEHSLNQLNKLHQSLQSQHSELYTLTKCQHPFQLRNLYKKQTQLALDLAYIERESYRQTKKTKNQQLNLYQERILDLLKENDNMKKQILDITSDYNQKIYQLKKTNFQTQTKLKSLQHLQPKLKNIQQDNPQIHQQNLKYLQIQLKLQNTKEKLQFYIDENTELRRRNLSLVEENNKLLEDIKQREKQLQRIQQHQSHDLNKIISEHDTSIDYIQSMMKENLKMRKEIEEITQKYVLLTETYPGLIQGFDTIRELQENVKKLNTLNQLENELSEAQLRESSLQSSLTSLQTKYLQELKARESIEYKSSILTKRFNEIFIKMNPYFNIYQYQPLQLKQEEYRFFDQNKNYNQLKEYEKEIYQLKRELKEQQHTLQTEHKNTIDKLQQKQRELNKLNDEFKQSQQKVQQMTTANKIITQKLQNYQLLNIDQDLIDQKVNQNKINTQISLPLLQSMVQRLQLERQELLKAIYVKDGKILELAQELRQATLNLKVQCIPINQSTLSNKVIAQNTSNNVYTQISELLKANQALEAKYEQSVVELTSLINKLQTQLNSQHDIYQLEIKTYEQEYKTQFIQLTKSIQNWISTSDKFKTLLQQKEHQLQKEKQQLKSNTQLNLNVNNQQGENANQMQQQPQLPLSSQMQQNMLMRHPSLTNLDRVTNMLSEQGNNKLIGESTVQTLTATLKKYQQEMNEVLAMCAKLTEEYTELKKQLKNQHQLQQTNTKLSLTASNLQQEISHLKSAIEDKNKSLTSLQSLYKNKESHCEQLKSQLSKQTQLITLSLQDEKRKNQLLNKELAQIKEKLYQISVKAQSQQINQQSLMNKGEFETIVVMHANKNKEISQLIQKNKSLQSKVQTLINQINTQQTQINTKKSQEITPLQQAQFKQLTHLLQQTNLIDLVKKANEIIQKQKHHEEQQRQQLMAQEQQKQGKMVNEGEEQQNEKSIQQ